MMVNSTICNTRKIITARYQPFQLLNSGGLSFLVITFVVPIYEIRYDQSQQDGYSRLPEKQTYNKPSKYAYNNSFSSHFL
jgi:hypothetical protein